MTLIPLALTGAAALLGMGVLWTRLLAARREAYIRQFELPRGLFERLRKQRPELSLQDCQLVAHAAPVLPGAPEEDCVITDIGRDNSHVRWLFNGRVQAPEKATGASESSGGG